MAKNAKVETTKKLQVRLNNLTVQKEALDIIMTKRSAKIRALQEDQTRAEGTKRDLARNIAETQNRLFAREALQSEVLSARASWLAKWELSTSDKITVAKQRILEHELKSDLTSLQSKCAHPFVFSYDGYDDRHRCSYDADMSHRGHRVCTLCNLHETSEGTDKDIYKILVADETRLVRRDLRNEKDRPKGSALEWLPAPFLGLLFERSAGGINVHWPEIFEKSATTR